MKPLAYRLRPKSFDDVVGQDHLVGKDGVIRKMLQEKKLFSMILYGAPGTGKTTIASIIADQFPFNHYFFNASTDSKQKLKEIADDSKLRESTIVIIDEIHRMKSDVQDFLLPFIESGAFIMIGLTATPKTDVDRNTYDFFEVENGVPTYAYDYETAVYTDHVLVPYYNYEVKTKFLEDGITYDD